jgi:transcriptional regulator with XRE-family HTH domain
LEQISLTPMKTKGINFNSNFGEFLRETRKEVGLNQKVFANKIGISQSNYARLERGNGCIRIEKLQKISRALNISLSELFKQVEKL